MASLRPDPESWRQPARRPGAGTTVDPESLARTRDLLGDEATGLTDAEITRIARHADAMARVVVEVYLSTLPSTSAA